MPFYTARSIVSCPSSFISKLIFLLVRMKKDVTHWLRPFPLFPKVRLFCSAIAC